jgi:antitoxin VapB
VVYIIGIATRCLMADTAVAKIFMHGRSQAVRLPKEFRLPGKEVRIRRVGTGVLLEPIQTDIHAWLARVCELADPDFPDPEPQPPPPDRDVFD